MRPICRIVLSLCTCLLPASALAQTAAPDAPSVELVSPGGPGQPTLTTACPTFSWAPGRSVAGYELAVFELSEDRQPRSTPVLHVALSGRATTWTPAATSCLLSSHQFGWYMREISRQGDKPGRWTSALSFTVLPVAGDSSPRAGVSPTAQPTDPGNAGGGSIVEKLDDIIDKLEQLLNPPAVTKESCFEMGVEAEAGLEGEVKLAGGADGSAGAKAFANGVKAWLKANGELTLASGAKGGLALKRSWCWDPLIQPSASAATLSGLSATSTNTPLTDAEFVSKLTTLSQQLQLGDDRFGTAMDSLPGISVGNNPWDSLRASGPVGELAEVLPLPDGVRTALRDPGQILANFRAQLDLCSQSNLPAVIAGVVSEFCQLANTERFSKLLDRVDDTVQDVETTVNSTRTVVNNINSNVNAIKTKIDELHCRFFCSQP